MLAALVVLGRWFARADPGTLATTLKWVGVAIAVLVAILLFARVGVAAGLGTLGAALMLLRGARAVQALRGVLGGTFGPPGAGGAGGPSRGQSSSVETAYLRMALDHDTGQMDGTVLQGPFEGRKLSALSHDDLFDLLGECAGADEQSARLLETYLDRNGPADWRDRMEARQRAAGGADRGPMSREEAREILGVGLDATPEQIKAAHRDLMQKLHPDRGGSTYLAAKINLAKELLLGA